MKDMCEKCGHEKHYNSCGPDSLPIEAEGVESECDTGLAREDGGGDVDVKNAGWSLLSEKMPSIKYVVDLWRGNEQLSGYYLEIDYDGEKGNTFFDPYVAGECCVRDATHWKYQIGPDGQKIETGGEHF